MRSRSKWYRGALCSEEGCERPALKRGRCGTCYNRWYKSPDFVPAPPPPPYVPRPDPVCPWCGPYKHREQTADIICPTCGLDEHEHRYIDRILADSTAVWLEENAEFQRQRSARGDAKA